MTLTLTDTGCPKCDDQPAIVDGVVSQIPSRAGYVWVLNEDEQGEYHTLRKCYNCNHRSRARRH